MFSGLEENFCITDAPDIFHIDKIGSVRPDKEQRIQIFFELIEFSVEKVGFVCRMKHEFAQTGFKIHDFLKRDLVLVPVYMKTEQFTPVSHIVYGICQRFLKDFLLNGFCYEAVRKSLKDLIHIFLVVCDIDNEGVGILFPDRRSCFDPGDAGQGDIHEIKGESLFSIRQKGEQILPGRKHFYGALVKYFAYIILNL